MALSLAKIREQLLAQENRQKSGNMDTTMYPFWDINEGTTAKIRFLPDADNANPYFWVERSMIRLPFSGIVGQSTTPVVVQVPCVEMYGKGNTCPILNEVRPWWNDPKLEEKARNYWKKKSYIFQGFVRENPLTEDNPPENPIRRFVISPQIFNIIKTALLDPEMESMPTDYDNGLDFIVAKTMKGKYADYTTSKWSRKESALNQEELEAIDEFGLFNLSEFLPKKPSEVELKVMFEMFTASLNNEPYDPVAWGDYYRPYGMNTQTSSNKPVVREEHDEKKAVPKKGTDEDIDRDGDDDSDVTEQQGTTNPSKSATDVLAMLRARKNQS